MPEALDKFAQKVFNGSPFYSLTFMESANSYEVTESLNQGQRNVLDFVRKAGRGGVSWVDVRNKCQREGITPEEFDSLSLLELIKMNEKLFFIAVEYL